LISELLSGDFTEVPSPKRKKSNHKNQEHARDTEVDKYTSDTVSPCKLVFMVEGEYSSFSKLTRRYLAPPPTLTPILNCR